MKRLGIIIVMVMALGALAGVSWATIIGSPHDLSGDYGTNQVCIFCHTPHNAQTANVPLWNHGNSAATYTLYTNAVSSTFTATNPTEVSAISKACLSCHDGTVALDTYGTNPGDIANVITGTANLGTGLSNDHPISFTYDAALASADGGLVSPASASLVVTDIPLFSGKLECSSCHNVHEHGADQMFLRSTNAGSALCMKCHNK